MQNVLCQKLSLNPIHMHFPFLIPECLPSSPFQSIVIRHWNYEAAQGIAWSSLSVAWQRDGSPKELRACVFCCYCFCFFYFFFGIFLFFEGMCFWLSLNFVSVQTPVCKAHHLRCRSLKMLKKHCTEIQLIFMPNQIRL